MVCIPCACACAIPTHTVCVCHTNTFSYVSCVCLTCTPPPPCSGFYDRKKLFWKEIEGVTLCAACGPPGGGRQEMSTRLLRHFTLLCMPPPSEISMRTIFSAILGGFLDVFFSTGEVQAQQLYCIAELHG